MLVVVVVWCWCGAAGVGVLVLVLVLALAWRMDEVIRLYLVCNVWHLKNGALIVCYSCMAERTSHDTQQYS